MFNRRKQKQDYEAMPYLELKALRDKIDGILAQQYEQARTSFQEEFLDRMHAFGLSLDDLRPHNPQKVKKTRRKKTATIEVKYRDPANAQNTWTGRGQPKKWLKAYPVLDRKSVV